MSKKNIYKIVIGIILILAAGSYFLRPNDSSEEAEQLVAAKKVGVTEINKNNQSMAVLQKTVILASQNSAQAIAEYSGRITSVNFEVGDYVGAGQVLAYFDQSGLANANKLSYESLQNTYEMTKDTLKETKNTAYESIKVAKKTRQKAEIELEQAENDGDQDEIDLAEKDLDIAEDNEDSAEFAAKNSINAAEIQLEQIGLQLNQARINYEKTLIKAPISGQIVSKNVSNFDYLSSGTSVAQIVQKGEVESKIYLSRNEVSRIAEGDLVKIEKDGAEFDAKVFSVATIANPNNQRFEVSIRGGEDLKNLVNQTVKISLTLKISNDERYFIPLESVNIGQKRKEVFVVKDGLAKSTEVITGDIIGNSIEIISGISEGDLLIVDGNKILRDGEKVTIKN